MYSGIASFIYPSVTRAQSVVRDSCASEVSLVGFWRGLRLTTYTIPAAIMPTKRSRGGGHQENVHEVRSEEARSCKVFGDQFVHARLPLTKSCR